MVILKPGVLLKLLEDIKEGEDILEEERKPVLLQIRGIIPVLEEDNLWPNRGFYLKVSDLSHSAYVSLPQEQNDMIFSNKLKLGQYIYVQNLEKSQTVPLLRGLTSVPGLYPCEGTPEDIVPEPALFNYSDSDSIVEKGVISEKKIIENTTSSGMSDSNVLDRQQRAPKVRSSSASRIRPDRLPKTRASSAYDDSDCESTISSISSSSISKRKSWNESEILGLKDIYDSSVVKDEIRHPTPPACRRSRSATASPVRSSRYDSSDDNASSITRMRDASCTKKVARTCSKNKNIWPKSTPDQTVAVSCTNERKGTDNAMSWGSLSPSLVKLGKELVKQRDAAVIAAADALQEASAADRMLNSLSVYSDILLVKGGNVEPRVDKFFDLQDDLAQTRLIVQSLTNVSPVKTGSDIGLEKEALKIALERKKRAISWIQSAIALDLSPCSTTSISSSLNPCIKKSKASKSFTKPKGAAAVINELKSTDDLPLLTCENGNQVEWMKGNTISAASDLATTLQHECRRLFLGYVDKYLEEVEKTSSSTESDSELAAMMFKVKKVNDWLDVFIGKEHTVGQYQHCNKVISLDDSEIEVYERVRNKIYSILLKHVERTALALESVKASS